MSTSIENPMAGASPDNEPNQTVNEKLCDGKILIGYGKAGHGMNGKDADQDRVGQCLVTSLETVDPVGETSMRIDIHLRLYASICSPSYDSIDFAELKAHATPVLRETLRECCDVDLGAFDPDDDSEESGETQEKIVEFFQTRAAEIVGGMDACPGDPWAFMSDDDGGWSGGTDITLTVPLSVDEYDLIEQEDEDTLNEIAQRISTEICAGNKGGTPERDRMKHFETEVGLCNDALNALTKFAP